MPLAGAGAGLSALGRRQAEEAADYIAGRRADLAPLAALYTSPLLRTQETAAIIGKALDLVPAEDARLADADVGEWSGLPLKQLARRPEWATVMHYPTGLQFPGGEALADVRARVAAALRAITAAHAGQAVIVVSHADPIRSALTDAFGAHLDLFQRVTVEPASVSIVSYSPWGPSVLLVNWTGASRVEGRRGKR
jgi:broad specificity phosphatase PhoE